MGPTCDGGGDRVLPTGDARTLYGLVVVALVCLVAAVSAAPAAAAPADAADTTFLVVLDESGDAEVTLRLTFDVSTQRDREALAPLRQNRSTLVETFGDGMAAVAARAAEETGREMTVSDAGMSVSTADERGVVDLSVTWRGLAAVDGDVLRLTAPFDEGFRPPGRFVLRAPADYSITSATPAPTNRTGPEVAWAAGTRLDGFGATIRPESETSTRLPGFGVTAALAGVAILAAVAAVAGRRRS